MKLVSIITVNFNHNAVTDAMLDSILLKNKYSPIEIIVVDNGSTINPIPVWKQKYTTVKFIRSNINLGFAAGNNLGIESAKGDYLFLANNDTEFTESLIPELVRILETHPDVGIVSPKIRYYDQPDMIQYAGFTPMNYYTARNKCIGQFEIDNGQYDNTTGETGYAHGAAMMVSREAMNKAGLMAENYFLYYEEMDWCDHIRKAGYTIWVNMNALIYHKESVSVGGKSALKEYFMNRNRILFIRRNCKTQTVIIFTIYFLLVVASRNILNYIKDKQWQFIPILLRAIFWNFTNGINSRHLGYTVIQAAK